MKQNNLKKRIFFSFNLINYVPQKRSFTKNFNSANNLHSFLKNCIIFQIRHSDNHSLSRSLPRNRDKDDTYCAMYVSTS
jgi:hypothetical protein